MTVYIVIEYGEPQDDTLYAITNLPLYFEQFNEDFGTDYSTMEEFNEHQIDREMYAVIIPNTQS
jgi:hypothetical protein|tara:strand:+ start:145 stop:336 length:192 start_codon:yes stop_codon:yes gene_type:complete